MGRKCKTCLHADVAEIDQVLALTEVGYRSVAKRYGIPSLSVFRHRQAHLPRALLDQAEKLKHEQAVHLLDEATRLFKEMKDMFDQAREELQTDGKWDLSHRGEDMMVRYITLDKEGHPRPHRATLAEIYLKLAGKKMYVTGVSVRGVDPRDLVLKVADRADRFLRLIGEIRGELKQPTSTIQVDLDVITRVIVEVLRPYPAPFRQALEKFRELNIPLSPSKN